MSESSELDLGRVKQLTLKTLSLLKFFYSFRELEKILGVHSQVLWRYVTLRAVPEKDTAARILSRIREEGVIEDVLRRSFSEETELGVILSNPGLLELAAIKLADEYRGSRVECTLSAPDNYSAALASLVSVHLRTRLCILSRKPLSKNIVCEPYQSMDGVVDAVAIPRGCIQRKSRVLIVTVNGNDKPGLKAALNIALKCHGEVIGLFALTGCRSDIVDFLEKSGFKVEFKVSVLVENSEFKKH